MRRIFSRPVGGQGARARTILPVACLVLAFGNGVLRADALAEIQRRGELVWGADEEGGGPYVYRDPENPKRLIGFEVELAELMANHLGVRARFSQKNWDTLPQFLKAGEIDIILNGYEWTPERAALMEATRPYYIYELQLLAKAGDSRIQSWDDLRRPPKGRPYSVGVLEGSAAATYVREHLGDQIALRPYDGNTNAMMQVSDGADAATVQDLPIAIFYRDLPQGRGLRFVGSPVGRGHYVMYARRGESRLVNALNAGLERAIRDGRLKAIYEKYHLWNDTQEQLATAAPLSGAGKAVGGWAVVLRHAPTLLLAALTTILLSVTAMPLAIAIGLMVALGRMYGPNPCRLFWGSTWRCCGAHPSCYSFSSSSSFCRRCFPSPSARWSRPYWGWRLTTRPTRLKSTGRGSRPYPTGRCRPRWLWACRDVPRCGGSSCRRPCASSSRR